MEQSHAEVQEPTRKPIRPFGMTSPRRLQHRFSRPPRLFLRKPARPVAPPPAANGGTATSPSWIYAIGNIEARFPSLSVEKEFAQATGRDKTSGLTDRQALHTVLSKPENRYLLRQLLLCHDDRGTGDLHPDAARPGGSRPAGGSGPPQPQPAWTWTW